MSAQGQWRTARQPRLVTVVVPVLNARRWLDDQLAALAAQTYRGAWEVVIVDNGSSDGSTEIARQWADRLPGLRVVAAHDRRSLNHARNVGAHAAEGDFLAFCDADDVVLPHWLEALVDAAPQADVLGGTFDLEALNSALSRGWRPDEPLRELPVEHSFLPYVSGGNCGIWTSVARELGWDEHFPYGSSDTEFSWRAQLADYRLDFVPEAVVQVRYRESLRELASQYYSYGRSAPSLYRCFRHVGMRRDLAGALWWWRWLLRRSPDLLGPPVRRGNWIRVAAFRAGRIHGSLSARVLFL